MRRSGRLVLFLGVLLLIAAVAVGFVLLQPGLFPGIINAPVGTASVPTLEPEVDVVVAAVDIRSSTVITEPESLLVLEPVPASRYNPAENLTSIEDAFNLMTTRNIAANQVLRVSDLTQPGLAQRIPTAAPGEVQAKAYPLQVSALTGVADQLVAGDYVDMIATYEIERVLLRPSFDQQGIVIYVEERYIQRTTKTLLQNVQVLDILRPPPVTDETAAAGEAPPPAEGPSTGDGSVPTGPTLVSGNWVLLLAVTDQQAEIIQFTLDQGVPMTLVLRGAGDSALETTTGVTFDILFSQYGLPLPRAIPIDSVGQDAVTPQPISTIAPTQTVAPTP